MVRNLQQWTYLGILPEKRTGILWSANNAVKSERPACLAHGLGDAVKSAR